MLLGGIVALVCVCISFHDEQTYAGIDLRPKIVGARALLSGRDPYATTWNPAEGERLLNPRQRIPGPSGNTYAPTLLLFLYGPTCWLSFRILRLIWWCAEWAALGASVYWLSSLVKPPALRRIFVLVAVLFFVNSSVMRLHAERGQYYVFLLFTGTLGWFLHEKGNRRGFWGMVVLGFLGALRPTYAIMALPLWLLKFRREAIILVLSCAVFISLTLPVGGLRAWKRYVENVDVTQAAMQDPALLERLFGPAQEVPHVLEGMDFRPQLPARITSTTFIQFMQPRLTGDPTNKMHWAWLHLNLEEPSADQWLLRIDHLLAAVSVGLFALCSWWNRGGVKSFRMALFIGVVLALDIDYFLPQRYFNDMLFLWPIALSFPVLFCRRAAFPCLVLLASGLLFGHSIIPTTEWSLITSLRSFLVMGASNALALASLAWPSRSAPPPKAHLGIDPA